MGKFDEKLKKQMKTNATEAAKGFKQNVFDMEQLGDTKFYAPEEGKNKIDIIPYLAGTDKHPAGIAKGDPEYVLVYHKHKGLGPEQKNSAVCPKMTFGSKCPICEERDKLMADGQEELANGIKAKKYAAYWVIDKTKDEDELSLFDIQYFFFEKELCDASMNPDDDEDSVTERPVPFAALEGGFSVKFRATEETFGKAKFKKFKDFKFIKRKEDYDECILEETIPLDSLLVVKSYAELKELLYGEDEVEPDDMLPARKEKTTEKMEDDDVKKETPKKKSFTKKAKTESADKESAKCPHGYRIGVDIDKKDDCEDCEMYKECADISEKD